MSKGRLTRQELGWLLTQEAQGAAERLRKGVSALTQAPPPPGADSGGVDATGVDATLSALDEAMKMLSSLHQQPVSVRGRRGRIDLASLLWEVAPDSLVSMEPGGGTEVFGDEAELRRMLHVMLGHGSGGGSNVSIRREGDEVVLAVVLGPENSATADAERAWLSRMAIRYGGRYELEGSSAVLAIPAEGVEARDDVARLRKELDEARRQGEAYARELAAVWTGEDMAPSSSYPPPQGSLGVERFAVVVRMAAGIAATMRSILSPAGRDVTDARASLSPRKSSPDAEARVGLDEQLESVARRLVLAQEFVAELGAVGEVDPREARRAVDLAEIVRGEARALEGRAERAGVDLSVRSAGEVATEPPTVRVAPRAVATLMRQLIGNAVNASRRGSSVVVVVQPPSEELGARVVVDDGGTQVPAGARRALIGLAVEPGTFGRPTGIALFLASEIAAAQGAQLDVGDAPSSGGVRVSVTFPR